MQSDTSNSSSVKRPVSDGTPMEPSVRTPSSDQMSSLTLADSAQDIDSYMAEQGEADIPLSISLTPPHDRSSVQNMTPAERVSFVEEGKIRKMEPGETWYLVSKGWLKRWKKACTGEVDKDGAVTEEELGPVDNSSLLAASGGLVTSLTEGVDVEYVPEDVWDALTTWYGPSQQPLPRRVITRGQFTKTPYLELRPPSINVYRIAADNPTNLSLGPPNPTIQLSISDSVKTLCERVADAVRPADVAKDAPYRVWKLDPFEDAVATWTTLEFPAEKLKDMDDLSPVEEKDEALEAWGVDDGDVYCVEFKGSSGWLVEYGSESSEKRPLAIEAPPPLFNSNDAFFNRFGKTTSSTATTSTSTDFYSGFGNKSYSATKSYSKPLEPGTLGLGNMGNTCFMNSALQCLAHTKELAEYFLSGVFKNELNVDNPLGMQGAIAEVFGALLERIWASSGPSNSYSPREFKQTLQRFAPQFSGYQQHDTQELVAFLLDGLHEDLNRVLKKPYVEKPDWEGGGDVELVKLAKDSWDGYMLRNDSVIVDLFQGQYQSTLVCPECRKVSITFDPFMYLTLPLPVERKWRHPIFYIPWDLDKPHVKVPVEVNREGTFKDVRALLGKWMDAIPDNLLIMEIFQNRFYKSMDDRCAVSDVSPTDTIVCFELPCNSRQSWKYERKPEDPFIVPMFLTDHKQPVIGRPTYARTQPSYFGYPSVVVITQEQSQSVDAMYDAVVARLERWTTNARDLYNWEAPDETVTEIPTLEPSSLMESVTEITPEGDVREVHQPVQDGENADEKGMDVDQLEEVPTEPSTPQRVHPKRNAFDLRLQSNNKEFGSSMGYSQPKYESWEVRESEMESLGKKELLKHTDSFFCEFDENIKSYFFGEPPHYEHARWGDFAEYVHPDYAKLKKAGEQKKAGLTLEDCLEEFVREEQLGEDDLWYCPQCKKHQQATKKFDLWKAPDILVVHLKRFSNNRILRDKIDTFVDFPIEGLDLSEKVGERLVAKRLKEQGIELEDFKDINLDEPLLYDLFAVDEHMGGLGGGHYRAYSSNHMNGKWYHFDDGYVTTSKAESAVNANAYLLFYRRRSSTPLGGKTHLKVEEHKVSVPQVDAADAAPSHEPDGQLPTPPSEPEESFIGRPSPLRPRLIGRSPTFGPSLPSPPADDDDRPTYFNDTPDSLVSDSYDTFRSYTHGYPLSDDFRKASPTSSNEAEVDGDLEELEKLDMWDPTFSGYMDYQHDGWTPGSGHRSPSYSDTASGASPLRDNDDLFDEVEQIVQTERKDKLD